MHLFFLISYCRDQTIHFIELFVNKLEYFSMFWKFIFQEYVVWRVADSIEFSAQSLFSFYWVKKSGHTTEIKLCIVMTAQLAPVMSMW